MTINWMAVLRVPPYQAHYPTHPRGYRCPICRWGGNGSLGARLQTLRSGSVSSSAFADGNRPFTAKGQATVSSSLVQRN
jgi:hypothetical protein